MGNQPPPKGRIELVPLGTGRGATSVYEGEPSSSFALVVDGKCRLLVDMGLGVVRQARRFCGAIPDIVYVSHNHSDHSGDLPVALIVEEKAGHRLTIVSAPEVADRLRQHRIHELYSTGKTAEELANWKLAPEGIRTSIDASLSLVTYRGRHSELSYGFVLYENDQAILGFSADSGFDRTLYENIAAASTLVIDARTESSAEHASFEEVASFTRTLVGRRVFVTGYGTEKQGPTEDLAALRIGEPVTIVPRM